MTDMDVCLLLEGTYPFVTGGVSSWVHTLITEMKHLRFGVVHISPREGFFPHGYAYKLPENVVSVREVYLHQYKLPKKASRESIREQIQLFRGFIQDLQDGNTQAFREFYAAVNQDLGGGLNAASIFQTKESWDVLVESYSQEAAEESFINYFWTWRYALFPLFNILAAQLPDAHLYHTISTGYAGMLAAGATLRKGRPMVLTEHGIYAKERRIEIHRADWIQDWSSGEIVAERKPPFFKRFWTRQFAMMSKVTYAHANEIYTLYEGNRRTQIQDGAEPERTNVIPNGIDLVRYGEAAKQFDARAENERFTLAFVGRVSPIKDVKTFLRAVRLVANEVPNVRARILGPMDEDPKYVDACKKLFQRLHLDGIAAFEGKVNVLEEFPKIDLLVLTSISEAQPLVILEAGAVGVPTVTTDVGSCSELLNGSSPEDRALGSGGLLTPIASPGETAKAILQLIRDRDQLKRMGRAMRQRVHRFYALKDMIAAYGDIYGKFQPGGRCFGGAPDAQRSAEKRAEPTTGTPTPAIAAPSAAPSTASAAAAPTPLPSAAPLTAAPAAAAPALPQAVTPVPAAPAPLAQAPVAPAPAAPAPAAPVVVAAAPAASLPAAPTRSSPSSPSVSERTIDEPVPPIEIEPEVVPLVVESKLESIVAPPALPLLAPPALPDLPRVLEAMAPPAPPILPSTPEAELALREPSPATPELSEEPATMPIPSGASSRGVLGELLELQGLLDAWIAIDVELALLVQEAQESTRAATRAEADAQQEPEQEAEQEAAALATESDEFELGEEDLPADLPLSCEALGDDGAAIETRAAKPRSDEDLGLELIDDLMQELGEDAQGLRAALEREGDELSQLEQELICLDETEKQVDQPNGPLPEDAQTWWGSSREDEHVAAAEHSSEEHASTEAAEAIEDEEPATTSAGASSDDEEEWLELDDEELPRDMPLSCDVLGAGTDDDEEHAAASADGVDGVDESVEPAQAVAAPELRPAPQSVASSHADEAEEQAEAEEEAEIRAEVDALAEEAPSAARSASDDEFELGEEDLPADLPLSCEALGDDGAAIETRAAKPRSEDDLGLELIDDLMQELGEDAQGLRAALEREGDELSQLEQELICLDETEKQVDQPNGPLPEDAQTWWGSSREDEHVAAAEHSSEEHASTEAAEAIEDEEPATTSAGASSDDAEEWLELDDEELPRDMPLSCDVLGEGTDDDEEHAAASADEVDGVDEAVEPAQAVAAPELRPTPQSVASSHADEAEAEEEAEIRTEVDALAEEAPSAAPSASDDEFELGEEDLPADLPLSCEALGDDGAAIETRAAKPRSEDDLGLELIDDLMQELAEDAQGLRAALQREGDELSQLEQDLICLDETEKQVDQPNGPLPEDAQTWWGSSREDEHVAAAEQASEEHASTEAAEAIEDEEPVTTSAGASSDDEEEWLELDDEELPRDMPLSCDVLGAGTDDDEEHAAASADKVDEAVEPAQAVAAPELRPAPQSVASSHADEAEEQAEAEEEAEIRAEVDALAEEAPSAARSASDDEFELGEEDLPADLPLSCEALGDDGAAIETRAAKPRSEDDLGLELIDDLMQELAEDAQGLRAALQREGDELSQLEQDLICLDESTALPEGGTSENAAEQAHAGLRDLAGDAPAGPSLRRFAAAPASVPPDPEVIAELDEPEAESAEADDDGWLELEDEELPRDMPLSCSALGDVDDEDEDELSQERDEEDPA